jgi:branched-chain amino acid transport system permease protein
LSARLRVDARLLPILAIAVLIFGVFAHGNATLAQAGTYAGIYAIAAIGLSLLLGNVDQISVGQAGFFALGAYAVAYGTATLNWPFWPCLIGGIVIAGVVGLGLGFIALRFKGHYLAMATLAFGLIVAGFVRAIPALGGAVGISDIPYATLGPWTLSGYLGYWFAWAVVAIAAMLSYVLLRGRTGYAFASTREDTLAAEVAGVPTRFYKIIAFAFAGALAGAAGGVYASILGTLNPDAVNVALSIDLLLMVVLGGAGSIAGAIVGASLVGYLDIAGHQFENYREVAYGALVIIVVIAAPGGIVGLLRLGTTRRAVTPSVAEGQRATMQTAAIATPMLRQAQHDRAGAPPPLEIRNVTKRFGGLVAVDDVSFTLEPGTLTSLIGPNGAGKTTLFNAICGVGRVTSGSIRIGGIDVTGAQPHRVAALGVGRTFQNARLFAEMTVRENVIAAAYRASGDARVRADATLARLQLDHLADVMARDLAFGDRRRVELARAVAADPWLLLVDEPAAGLNHTERTALTRDLLALRDAGTTLLLVEHDMKLVMSVSQRVMVLRFGKLIADGAPAVVRADRDVIAAYLGTAG